MIEKARGTLEVSEYLIDDPGGSSLGVQELVAEPIEVYNQKQKCDGPHEVHNLGQSP